MTETSPPCGLYLRISSADDLTRIIPAVRQAAFVINRSDYDRNMHIIELDPGSARDHVTNTAIIELIKAEGLVGLVRGSADMALALGADGVLINSLDEIAPARALLGEEKIIGITCGNDRDLAVRAREAGADYIIFGAPGLPIPSEIFAWWVTSTDVPSVAAGPVTNDNASIFVRAGATFVDCSDYVWGYEKGVVQAVTNMLYAIDLAADSVKTLN